MNQQTPARVSADARLRKRLPDRWVDSVSALKIVTLKPGMTYAHHIPLEAGAAYRELEQIREEGFGAIEIFAPAHGLRAYNGLDTVDHYRIDPHLGTMDDFRRLVNIAHEHSLAVIVFINVGYLSVESAAWKQACLDKAAGTDSEVTRWFLWADTADAPAPPTHEDQYATPEQRAKAADYWGWFYSEEARRYYWARWHATDEKGAKVPLPQNNWQNVEWRREAESVVEFWMATGIDGIVVDAPLCYPYQTWQHNRRLVEIMKSHGNVLTQPEAGRDLAWVTEAGYNCMQNYGFSYIPGTREWTPRHALAGAISRSDASELERSLRFYHDEIVGAGAVLYTRVALDESHNQAQRHLQVAILAGLGDIIVYGKAQSNPDSTERELLRLKGDHSALFPRSLRRTIDTNGGVAIYAILKTSVDGAERILCVYNLSPDSATIQIEVTVIGAAFYHDLLSGEVHAVPDPFSKLPLRLPAYGYAFLLTKGVGWQT